MKDDKILDLKKKATDIRLGAVEAVYCGKSGHPGGALSCADILACLYFSELRINPKKPQDPDRDRIVLSKGHSCPALYTAMAMKGYFDKAYENAAFELEIGEVSPVVETQDGFYIIQRMELNKGYMEDNLDALKGIYFECKMYEIIGAYADELDFELNEYGKTIDLWTME